MGKASGSTLKLSSKTNKQMEIIKYRIKFFIFPYISIAERLLYFDILGKFSMNLKITLCLPATSLVNFPLSL